MADKDLSSLTAGSTLDGTELAYIVQGGNSRKITLAGILGVTHSQAWSSVTGTPTTLAGYGITDAQAKSSKLTAIAALSTTDGGFIVGDGSTWVVETGSTARASLGLAIGTDVQAYNAGLADIAGLAKTDGGVIIGDGTNFTLETGATLRSSLGLAIGSDVQAYDAALTSIASLTLSSGDILYSTGSNAYTNLAKGADGQVLSLVSGLPTWTSVTGTGDMIAAVYDPNSVGADAFSQDSMVDGTTNKNYTATDKAKVDHLTVTGDINLDDALLAANDPDATTDFVIGLLRYGGREFIPEAHGAAASYVAGTDDAAFIQTAIANAYSRYVLTGRTQAVRLLRRYELANPRSVGVANFEATLFRNVFLEVFPGVDIICDPGAGIRVADGMDAGYDHVVLYNEDSDHPSLGPHKWTTVNFDIDYNPDNNARDHYVSGPYQGTGVYIPAVTPVAVEFINYHSYGCQQIADISATQITSSTNKKWVSNITSFKLSGFIEEFGRNTGSVSVDTSAVFIHADPEGEIFIHNFTIEGAIGTNDGKRLNTGMELHGNVVFGDNVNIRYFYVGTLWMSTYAGNNRVDTKGLNVSECAMGISLWPLKDPNASATPAYAYKSIKLGGARVRLRPHQWFYTHPWQTASATIQQSGGAVTGVTMIAGGHGYDPSNPPVFSVSGTGGGTVVLGTPTFTSGKTIGAFVKECGSGYTSQPTVTPSTGDSVWEALVDGRGRVYAVNLVSGGASDTAPPTLTFSGGGGTGASAKAFGSWGVASIPVTNGGSGVSGSLTLAQNDSANGILRNGGSMLCAGLYLNPPGTLTPLPMGTLDLTGFDVKLLDETKDLAYSANSGVQLLQSTGSVAYNIDELIVGGVYSGFSGPGILISNTVGQPYNKLINNGTIIRDCCRSTVVNMSSFGPLHIVATAGTIVGQITDLSGPLHIRDGSDVAGGMIRLVNTNSDTASIVIIDNPTLMFKDGGSTTKPFSFSITNASTILSLKAKMDEGHYGSGNYVDCKTGSRVDFTDSAKYVVKTASGSSNWKAKDLNPAITVAQPTITSGTAVQNTSDRYMHIAGMISFSTGGTCQLAIGSTSAALTGIGEASSPDAARVAPFSLVVPPGYWYKITLASATVAVTTVLLGPA